MTSTDLDATSLESRVGTLWAPRSLRLWATLTAAAALWWVAYAVNRPSVGELVELIREVNP